MSPLAIQKKASENFSRQFALIANCLPQVLQQLCLNIFQQVSSEVVRHYVHNIVFLQLSSSEVAAPLSDVRRSYMSQVLRALATRTTASNTRTSYKTKKKN
eukprot:2127604-Amphidinium_carterae.1